MTKNVIVLGSTGSIGQTSLRIISENKDLKIKLLTTNKNANKLLYQAIKFNVKDVIIEDLKTYKKYKKNFNQKKIRLHHSHSIIDKILKKKNSYCINAISGIEGLEPTLKVIPFTKNILISNKESIICGWSLIKNKLLKYKTNFIPVDSEHFSIFELIKFENINNLEKIILTASGGPFLKKANKNLLNISPKQALKHPNWNMGKKISIDSSTMMNKVFEFIEAKKIFNLSNKDISILIHPTSFIHSIIYLKGDIVKLLGHETSMSIPISNALGIKKKLKNKIFTNSIKKLNNLSFYLPNIKQFPVLKILDILPEKDSYFETILITINDTLVSKYLDGHISYLSIQKNLLNLIKKSYFKKYYNLKPKNIYDIKKMIFITKKYLNSNLY